MLLQGEASGLTALLRKQHAAQNTREFVRGSMGALPFTPGAPLSGRDQWLMHTDLDVGTKQCCTLQQSSDTLRFACLKYWRVSVLL